MEASFYNQIISFDELKTDYKNPIDLCNSLNPVSLIGVFDPQCKGVGDARVWTSGIYCPLLSLLHAVPGYCYHVSPRPLPRLPVSLSGQCSDHSFLVLSTISHRPPYATRPRMSVLGIYDPTAVMNGDEMDRNKKEGFVKLALYLINFFAGLLWIISGKSLNSEKTLKEHLVMPEYGLQGFIALCYLYYMQYLGIVIMCPLALYHAYRYATRPRMSVLGIYDPTAVMNGDEMDRNKKEGFVKLALYLINFFAGLLWMILAVSN
eukprot:sb/3468381/